MKIVANRKIIFKRFLLILLVLLSFNPYLIILQHLPMLNVLAGSLLHVILIFFFLFIIGKKGIIQLPNAIKMCLFVQVVGYLFSFAVHGGIGYLLMYALLLLMVLMFSYIEYKIGLERFFYYYNRWILIMALGGVGIFILGQLFGIPPIWRAQSVISSSTISSWGIGYTNTYDPYSTLSFIRYSGFFDEPGAMGYWGIYALVINKLFIVDKRIEWILLVALLFTFSFGYFLQVFVYVVFFYGISKIKFRNIWILALFVIAVAWIHSTEGGKYDNIYKSTFGRFEKIEQTSTGLNVDSRRDELSELAKKTFLEYPIFGVGIVKWSNMPYMADNPYETLAKDGLFGTFYLYFPYIVLLFIAIKHHKKDLLKGLVVIGLGFLHRPFHENLLAYFMLYSILFLTIKSLYKERIYESIGVSYNGCLQ